MDLTEFAEEIGSTGPVTVAGLATRGGPVDDVRTVMAPSGLVAFLLGHPSFGFHGLEVAAGLEAALQHPGLGLGRRDGRMPERAVRERPAVAVAADDAAPRLDLHREHRMRREDDHVVLEALRLLSDRQKSCLVLRFYLQLSESEIAETLGISKNSVKTHCQRGMAALEARLEVNG